MVQRRDVICKELTYIGVNRIRWYEEATRSRTGWKALCHSGITAHQDETQEFQGHREASYVVCEVCNRWFSD